MKWQSSYIIKRNNKFLQKILHYGMPIDSWHRTRLNNFEAFPTYFCTSFLSSELELQYHLYQKLMGSIKSPICLMNQPRREESLWGLTNPKGHIPLRKGCSSQVILKELEVVVQLEVVDGKHPSKNKELKLQTVHIN